VFAHGFFVGDRVFLLLLKKTEGFYFSKWMLDELLDR
jgi:hypothetical protein